jgi:hypothetical protein
MVTSFLGCSENELRLVSELTSTSCHPRNTVLEDFWIKRLRNLNYNKNSKPKTMSHTVHQSMILYLGLSKSNALRRP